MRLHTVLIILTLTGIMTVSVMDYFCNARTLGKKAESIQNSYSGKRFIAESFRNTCEGRGFESLEEWQLTCKQLFKLEYIAWCPCEEFMIDEVTLDGNSLLYGKWIAKEECKAMSGEVYYRINRSGF